MKNAQMPLRKEPIKKEVIYSSLEVQGLQQFSRSRDSVLKNPLLFNIMLFNIRKLDIPSDSAKFVALSVMYKIKGYNPEGGDWFWVKYSPDGKVEASGKVKGCIDCHSKQKDNDYIFTGKVKNR